MLEPSEDPQDAREDNPRTRERPSDQGRKAMMVVIALLLAKPMKVTGVWPDPPKEPRPAAPARRDAEELEIEPASSETLDAKIDGYYKLLDQIEARQRAREVSK